MHNLKKRFKALAIHPKRLRTPRLTKRQEFTVITALLTSGFIATHFLSDELYFWPVILLSLFAYIFSAVGLREDLKGVKWFTLLLQPTAYTFSLGLFYFLLPDRWLTRLLTAGLYAIGIYALLLVENIYSIAVNRTIQLLRVAHAVGFLATLVTAFFFLNTVFSFRLAWYYNAGLIFLVFIPLFVQAFWSVKLEAGIAGNILLHSMVSGLIVAELGMAISFWPLKPIMASLFLTTAGYGLIGIGQHYFAKRLFRKTIVEYVRVCVIVFILIVLTVSYR